jgi:uncharacterized surface protein with fasciclin (FAS1) repeats
MNASSRRGLFAASASIALGSALIGRAFAQANAPVVGAQSTQPQTNVIDSLAAAGNFDSFLEYARRAGAIEILRGAGPFTLLAPTNAAMERLPGSLREQLNPNQVNATGAQPDVDPVRLQAFVNMHIVEGRYTLAQLADRTTQLRTRNGNVVEVASQAGQEYRTRIVGETGFGVGGINNDLRPTRFIVPEIIASNGVVLPIDVPLIQ